MKTNLKLLSRFENCSLNFFKEFKNELEKSGTKLKVNFNEKWTEEIPEAPGVYLLIDSEKVVLYVGESANLKSRLKELKLTYKHPARRKIGEIYCKLLKIDGKNRFSEECEKMLNEFFKQNITVKYMELSIGRLDVEDYLRYEYSNLKGSKLLNKIGIRNIRPEWTKKQDS